jgi:hypothetical protein
MRIFISQSGPRSQALADALGTFIKKVIPGTTCWVSSKDIDKGARFDDAIRTSLGQSTAGIVCLTSENLNARWILYEAGALSTKGIERLWTFLLDIGHSKVDPPLSSFQHTNRSKNISANTGRRISNRRSPNNSQTTHRPKRRNRMLKKRLLPSFVNLSRASATCLSGQRRWKWRRRPWHAC